MFGVLGNIRNDFPAISDSRTRSSPAKPRELAPRPWPDREQGAKTSNAKGIEPEAPFRTPTQKNARRGSATCKRPPTDPRSPRKRPRTRKGRPPPRGPAAFLLREDAGGARKRKGGPPRVPPLPGALFAPPRPKPCATRPGGRRRPSLPQGRPCSTFGAGRLNFRVRHGSGCAPAARAAGPRGALRRGQRRGGSALRAPWGPHSARGRCPLRTVGGGGGLLCVPKGSAD